MAWSGLRSVLVAVALSVGFCGCGGGGGKSNGNPGGRGLPDGGAAGAGGGAAGGHGGGDDGGVGQVLPAYLGRIVLTPAALLFTDAGQSATLHAQAFDASGAPMAATFTFTSSRPDQVAVDSTGNVTSMVPVGSTQITVTGAGLTSQPLLVLVVTAQPGTVLVSDAQVIAGPTQIDPAAEPLPGAQVQVTLDGVGNLAPGTMLIAREGSPIAGRVVSTSPNGTHTDVVYTLPALIDMFARLDFQAGYDYTLQTAADDDAIAALAGTSGQLHPHHPAAEARNSSQVTTPVAAVNLGEVDIGPFSCKADVDPTGITLTQSVSVTPTLHFDAGGTKNDMGDWTEFHAILTGNIKASGKVTAKLAPGATASLSCKYKWKTFTPPIAGPASAVLAPRIPVGVKAGIKAAAALSSLELGGKLEQSADFSVGFSTAGDVASLKLGAPDLEPMFSIPPKDALAIGVEFSATLGAYASINESFLEFGLVDAFVGAKMKYTMMTFPNQIAANLPNKYELRAPVEEVSPGSSLSKLLTLFGGTLTFTTTISQEGAVIASSPAGMATADNKAIEVPALKPINFTINLSNTTFLGLNNVSGVHIYRVDTPAVMEPLNEVKYFNGPGPSYSWSWTPQLTDMGTHLFLVGFDDELVYSLDALGVTAPFWVPSSAPIQVNVGPPAADQQWSGNATITWTGTGTTTGGGTSMESGTETVTWVPGMKSADGVSFPMVATMTTFTASYTFTQPSNIGLCSATETYTLTVNETHTGAEADSLAHNLLTVIPFGDGTMAQYLTGVPGLDGMGPSTDDVVSTCGTSMHYDNINGISATGRTVMGTMPSDSTTISGSADYSSSDSSETKMYHATWTFQKM